MAKIVEPPKPRRVSCNDCRAVIEYLPEDVKTNTGNVSGCRRVTTYVKCPRKRCRGQGIIDRL